MVHVNSNALNLSAEVIPMRCRQTEKQTTAKRKTLATRQTRIEVKFRAAFIADSADVAYCQ